MEFRDILIHALLAAAIVAVVLLRLPPWAVALILGLGFLVREAAQLHPDPAWRRPWRWSAQKSAEWIGPLIVGLALALAFGRPGG